MKPITILSTKYDESLHWRYEAFLLEEAEWGWLTFTPTGHAVETHKGAWLNLHPYLRWHWRERWWDALLVFKESGRWLEWYCNIITPPRLEAGTLRFHDLDLDVVWHHEHGIHIADTDEFERHAVQMEYPHALIQHAWECAQRVKQMMYKGEWRFGEDPRALRYEEEMVKWHALSI
ncbi:MAG: DUF402 domain-containing protein [Chloroflexota bacterium]|nr:DUF402 domain-containing protein [Chloroflexota bacterium]